jgi:hypothetical protein
MEENQIDVMPR